MMRAAWSSVADMAIVPMQDILGLGSEARINTPSTLGNNWKWRATPEQIDAKVAKKLYHYMQMYGRVDKDIKTKKDITEGEEIKVGKDNKKNKENK